MTLLLRMPSGKLVDADNPTLDDIDIHDIAHCLSNLCRFAGRTPRFYSVAEHSMTASFLALLHGEGPEVRLAALLHDAAETFTGDIIRPYKYQMGGVFRRNEERIEEAIRGKFGILMHDWRVAQKYDTATMRAEMMAFWPNDLLRPEWENVAAVRWNRAIQHAAHCINRRESPTTQKDFVDTFFLIIGEIARK